MNIRDGRLSLGIKESNELTVGPAAKEEKGHRHIDKEETETAAVRERQ